MAKRQPKPEPFTIQELEEIAQSPALQGFDKVLRLPVLLPPTAERFEYKADTAPSTVEARTSSTVEGEAGHAVELREHTVEDSLASTVEVRPASTVPGDLWLAEGAEGVFTRSRVKRIVQAQDALTHVEEAVYDALWGVKKKDVPDHCRLTQMGYSELAKKARVSKRSIQSVVDRLLSKQFIEIETPANITTRAPTIYRVYGYAAVLKRLRDNGRQYVIQTGRGVFYAYPASTVEASPSSTVEAAATSAVVPATSSTVAPTSPSTVEARSTVNLIGKNILGIPSSSVSTIAQAITKFLPIDDDAVRRLIANCRERDAAATDDEIAYTAQLWINENSRNTSIRKPVAVMLTAVPKFFPSEVLHQYRNHKAAERSQSRELARKILDDPESPQGDRVWATQILQDNF